PSLRALESGANTLILRVDEVRAHDLELDELLVDERSAEYARADTRAPVGEQCEPHPALELRRGARGGEVAEARGRGGAHHELHAVAQALAAIEWPHADELQPPGSGESRAGTERAADEVAVFLQHPPEAQVRGAGIAVELRCGHVALLDAQC